MTSGSQAGGAAMRTTLTHTPGAAAHSYSFDADPRRFVDVDDSDFNGSFFECLLVVVGCAIAASIGVVGLASSIAYFLFVKP